ncbi:hypothetical protein ACFR9U_01875 [Halorientalis brevis]|uniref:DUF456 domain-containing protein n=1 Tax=Halorientalis brevis TaxID=1126241 RepID=A0ABD6C5Z4_9EURY|nr:hypothetical protein [Halorientalis brevis]
MAERTDQRDRSVDDSADLLDDAGVRADVDPGPDVDRGPGPDEPAAAASEATITSRLRESLASPFSGLFSVRVFLFVLGLVLVAMVAAGSVVPIPFLGGLAGFVGIATVGFGVGLADARPRYLELLLAGAIAAGLGTLLDHLILAAFGLGLPLVVLGVGAGSLAGLVGHYFGRDLRDGLTRDL